MKLRERKKNVSHNIIESSAYLLLLLLLALRLLPSCQFYTHYTPRYVHQYTHTHTHRRRERVNKRCACIHCALPWHRRHMQHVYRRTLHQNGPQSAWARKTVYAAIEKEKIVLCACIPLWISKQRLDGWVLLCIQYQHEMKNVRLTIAFRMRMTILKFD